MKTFALAVVIAAVAVSPAMAAKKKKPAAEPTVAERNEAGYRFVRDSLPVFMPTPLKMLYYSNPENKVDPAAAKKKGKKKA